MLNYASGALTKLCNMISRFYLSPICTECLGDGFISLANMYHRLEAIPGPVEVFYHHWPKYFELLWPFVQHPRDDIIFTKLPAPSDLRIDSSLKERWRPEMFKHVKRDDYVFHSSRAYSKVICKIHPFIASELAKLDIGDDQLLLNCTELDQDVKYLEFMKKYDREGHVTFQGHSIDSEQQIRFEFDIGEFWHHSLSRQNMMYHLPRCHSMKHFGYWIGQASHWN